LKDVHSAELKKEEELKEQERKVAEEKEAKNAAFWENLSKSEDPYDNLGEFAQYIQNNMGSTGVYIGQLEPPLKKIADDADEDAHLDRDKPEIIKFKFANDDH